MENNQWAISTILNRSSIHFANHLNFSLFVFALSPIQQFILGVYEVLFGIGASFRNFLCVLDASGISVLIRFVVRQFLELLVYRQFAEK